MLLTLTPAWCQVAFAALDARIFGGFVASAAAPIVTGAEQSSFRVDPAPTVDQRLFAARGRVVLPTHAIHLLERTLQCFVLLCPIPRSPANPIFMQAHQMMKARCGLSE